MQLTDPKGRLHTFTLEAGREFHTHRGLSGTTSSSAQPEGTVVSNTAGIEYLALRPLLADYVLSMPRGAAVVYPKDAGQIVAMADIFPGARVVEAGVGLRRAVDARCCARWATRAACTPTSAARTSPTSPAATSRRFFGGPHPAWQLTVGDLRSNLHRRAGRRPRGPGHARPLGVPRRRRHRRWSPAAS